MNIKRTLFTALICFVAQMALAQGVRVSGTLSDNDGPIMMGNVTERDANNRIISATQTDFNGNFSLQVKNTKNKLHFSYVGDKTKIVAIGDKTVFNVKLEPASTMLKEVTVRGKRVNAGGLMISKKELSVAQQTMSMEQVEGLAFTSADEALQGEIAGLDIVSNSGNLGAGTQMRLRGVTTLSANANPLIVVDDKIFDNPDENFDYANADEEQYSSLLSVNVEDIAEITVLKDAASTAVWGSRGANGVIKITTKRGSRGKPRINFSYKFTGAWQPEGYKLLNGDEYTMLLKEEFYNPSQLADRTNKIYELQYDRNYDEFENWNNNTDWVKAVTQFGAMHDFNVNLTGGGQKATFRISAGYKHQTGSIIEQKFQQFSTRMALDYNVSDRIRFLTNFALTYVNNHKNLEGTYGGVRHESLLGIAQKLAPNMSIYRQRADGTDTDEYYIMNPYKAAPAGTSSQFVDKYGYYTPMAGAYSSYDLRSVRALGNPVAIAHLAWIQDKTYRLTPDFTIKYEILGTETEKSRLTFNGRVDFDIFAESKPVYIPATIATNDWTASDYNFSQGEEFNSMKIGGRAELVFNPYFKNEDWHSSVLARYEMNTKKNNSQMVFMSHLPNGITAPTVNAYVNQSPVSSNSRSNDERLLFQAFASYKERYILNASLTMDGNSKFGPKNKWAYFPGLSARYNISDEPFMKWSKKIVSVFGIRASWGIVGRAPDADYLFYNTYTTSAGTYGSGNDTQNIAVISGMKLDDLRWEKTTSYDLGFNMELLDGRFNIDFSYYFKDTRDLLQSSVNIPSYVGFMTLADANVGRMTNQGWEMNFDAKKFIKIGKFSADFGFNVSQNSNLLKEMDESVLLSLNGTTWDPSKAGNYPARVQLNNSLGSIYGFRYKGVYQYTYEYLQNYRKENGLTTEQYRDWINNFLAGTLPDSWYAARGMEKKPVTAPVMRDADGNVVMTNQGEPQHQKYAYGTAYEHDFKGGDAIYEDVNHDGQINALDMVYLGNSLPKINGGFNLTLRYGNWTVKGRFTYRFGNKIVNLARLNLESMASTTNQSATVNYRWRKDGDETPMPRALYGEYINSLNSDRYVENGGFVRFQNLQIAYNFPKKTIKKWGFNNLQAYASLNNLYVWTKYSGVDPEVSARGYYPALDNSRTPRSKQFTFTLNFGF